MPRKKKSVQSHVPPLLFVNSPDFQPVPVLTPDLAVDNPVTARPVLIEDLSDSSWVSPQFRNCQELSKCQNSRRNHRYLSHTVAQTRHKFDENGDSESTTKLKFKPLTFLHENNSKTGMPSKHLTDVISVDMHNIVIHTPNLTLQQICGVENVDMDTCNGSSRGVEVTPARGCHEDRTEIHKLLKPSNLFCHKSLNTEKRKQYDDFANHEGESNLQILRKSNHPEMHNGNILNTPSNAISCHPQENDNGSANHLAYLISRTPREGSSNSAVLVVDTPKCDYSLTLRQRQLKYR